MTKAPKLNCRNWECGVVLPILEVNAEQTSTSSDGQDMNGLKMFKSVIPIPMKLPGQPYQGDKKPWYHSES